MENTKHRESSQNDFISAISSEFVSKSREHDFRQSTLREDKKRGLLLILIALIYVALICIDYLSLGLSDYFLNIAAARGGGIIINLSVLFLLLKTENENHFDVFLFVFSTYLCFENLYVGNLKPAGYTPTAIFDIITIMGLYIIMPTRLILKIIPCLAISLLSPSLRATNTPVEFNELMVAHVTSHMIGILFSNFLNKSRRVQYNSLLNEVLLKKNLEKTEKEIMFISERLAKQNKTLKESATTDKLTGIYNRRSLQEFAEEQWSRAVRNNEEFSVIMLDIDHFKTVNDTHGHQIGDIVLTSVANTLAGLNREYDRLGRWGGEEFMLFLPGTAAEQAFIIAERLRCKVSESHFRISDDIKINITISLGISSKTASNTLGLELQLSQADKALYEAKKTGRNKTCVFRNEDE